MPHTRDMRWQALVAAALIGLAGCAATGQPGESEEHTPSPALQELERTLPGRYATARETGAQPAAAALDLNVRVDRSAAPGELRLLMQQRRANDDSAPRRFALTLRAGDDPGMLDGEFAPLTAGGEARRRCSMQFRLRDNGLVGETDPRQCRFGEGQDETGLLKEIAFDGNQLVIGDRLIDINDPEAEAVDQIHAFFRVRTFSGWAGVHEGESWRVTRELVLDTGSGSVEPVDAAGMSLGITIGLAYYRMDRGQRPVLLRLTVSDSETGAVLGESWSAAGASAIGLALPELQVGLEE